MYFLVEITSTQAETAKAVWEKSSIDEAMMALFQGMASAIANINVKSAMFMVIDKTGAIQRYEYWERPGA